MILGFGTAGLVSRTCLNRHVAGVSCQLVEEVVGIGFRFLALFKG